MNANSCICKFISEHPDSWEQLMKDELSIKVRKDGDLAIFVYNYDCDFSNSIVQEARGIIIDLSKLEVVCWPFRKFGNYNEAYADEIAWETARVLEKVDGSILKLWFDRQGDRWQFSTNGTIRAENAGIDGYEGLTFADVIASADNLSDIPYSKLDKDKTYIFELVSPKTRVVIDYGKTTLYHIGTRHNITGLETEEDIGIRKPESYPLGSLDDCRNAAAKLNTGEGNDVVAEGFVVVDANWHRVKVKSPDYLVMHRLTSVKVISKESAILMLRDNPDDVKILVRANPHLEPVMKYYDFKLSELKLTADKIAELARAMMNEYSGDRAAVAKVLTRHRLSFIGFLAIDRGGCGHELLMKQPIEKLAKLIDDYAWEDLRSLFSDDKG